MSSVGEFEQCEAKVNQTSWESRQEVIKGLNYDSGDGNEELVKNAEL